MGEKTSGWCEPISDWCGVSLALGAFAFWFVIGGSSFSSASTFSSSLSSRLSEPVEWLLGISGLFLEFVSLVAPGFVGE